VAVTFTKCDGPERTMKVQPAAMRSRVKGEAATDAWRRVVATRKANHLELLPVWDVDPAFMETQEAGDALWSPISRMTPTTRKGLAALLDVIARSCGSEFAPGSEGWAEYGDPGARMIRHARHDAYIDEGMERDGCARSAPFPKEATASRCGVGWWVAAFGWL
jgi:hypothetical protein